MAAIVLGTRELGFPWATVDPFLFCVHHLDAYPEGNERLGPAASLDGRNLGQDFEGKDGWRMYHGHEVPGFPQHPHRGFETVTIVRRGYIDHSDSLGAAARFGGGDVQWLTAGTGVVHSEMFPLLDRTQPNPVELFQIWLNLPAADKLVEPHFTMLWRDRIPHHRFQDASGRVAEIMTVAGALGDVQCPDPPPHSWAAKRDSDVAIWCIRLEPGARWTVPPAAAGSARTLYFFRGGSVSIGGQELARHLAVQVRADAPCELVAGLDECELLLLQGRPIAEPVVQYGPFVMNSREQIQAAIRDYQRTGFGGWPWPADAPVHPRDAGRFARHANGQIEHKDD